MKKCKSCGAFNNYDSEKCYKCGESLNSRHSTLKSDKNRSSSEDFKVYSEPFTDNSLKKRNKRSEGNDMGEDYYLSENDRDLKTYNNTRKKSRRHVGRRHYSDYDELDRTVDLDDVDYEGDSKKNLRILISLFVGVALFLALGYFIYNGFFKNYKQTIEADKYLKDQQYDKAISAYKNLLKKSPDKVIEEKLKKAVSLSKELELVNKNPDTFTPEDYKNIVNLALNSELYSLNAIKSRDYFESKITSLINTLIEKGSLDEAKEVLAPYIKVNKDSLTFNELNNRINDTLKEKESLQEQQKKDLEGKKTYEMLKNTDTLGNTKPSSTSPLSSYDEEMSKYKKSLAKINPNMHSLEIDSGKEFTETQTTLVDFIENYLTNFSTYVNSGNTQYLDKFIDKTSKVYSTQSQYISKSKKDGVKITYNVSSILDIVNKDDVYRIINFESFNVTEKGGNSTTLHYPMIYTVKAAKSPYGFLIINIEPAKAN